MSTGANVSYLNVSFIANVNTANILTSNIQSANIVTANVQNLNVSTGANVSYLNVTFVANVNTANILTSNIQSANIVFANVQNLNVSTGANVSYLNVSFIANVNTANILTANIASANIVTANVSNLNTYSANITSLFVQTFANILNSNIVTAFHSNINVAAFANVFTANIYNGNVQTTFNVSGLLSATLHSGNASALSNINASNVTMGILPFRNDGAIGQGATAISINGSVGVNNQYLSSTGTSLQWVGPPAAIFSQVPTSTNQIFYNSGNVAIGIYNWTQNGVGYNTYPGVPLDVYGGAGSFSNVSDANQTGTIRIMQNAANWNANGGLEFKTGTNIAGAGHRILTTEIVSSSGIAPLIFQYRANTPVWSNAMVIHNGSTTPGYIGIGTMAPGFNLHVYQVSNTSPATITLQMSNTQQSSQLYLSNASGTTTQLYLNGPSLSSDGPANSATLRNNAGDLRLAGASTQPYIYLQTATNSVGFGTQTMLSSSNISFWCPNVSSSGFAQTLSADSKLAVSVYAGDPGQGQFVITGITNTNKRLAFMYDTSNNISLIQSMTNGTGPNPLILNGAGGNVGFGTTNAQQVHHIYSGSSGNPTGTGTGADSNASVRFQMVSIGLDFGVYGNGITWIQNRQPGTGLGTTYNMVLQPLGGSVGIGTNSPGYTFHTYGGSIGVTGTSNYLYYAVTNSTASGAYMLFDAATAGGSGRKYQIGSTGTGNNPGTGCFELYDATGGASRIVVNASGFVGIGVTAPIRTFHLNGGEFSLTPSITSAYFNVSDSLGSNGGNYNLIVRGLGTAGSAQVNMLSFQVLATTSYFSGSVGIANNSPSYPLDVTGKIRGSREIISSSITDYGQFRAIGSNYGAFVRNDGSDTYWLVTNSGDQYGSWNGLRPWRFNNASGYVTMDNGCTVNGGLTAGTGTVITGNEIAMQYYNTAGAGSKYVGVSGTGYCLGGMEIESTTLNGSWSQKVHFRTHYYAVSNGRRVTINETGYLGVGTETPNGRLHIYEASGTAAGTTTGSLIIDHGNNYGSSSIVFPSRINYGSDYGYIQYNDTRGGSGETANMIIGIQNDGDDHISLMPSGNVGINTLTPGYKLEVQGTIYSSSDITGGTEIYVTNWFRVNGGGGIYWSAYGGGWNMSDTTYIRTYGGKYIYCDNTITCAGDIIAYYSDMRLKHKIEPITGALDKIKTLSTFTYEVNDLGASFGLETGVRNTGFSAQEVQAIMPEVIRLAPFDMGEKNDLTGYPESKSGQNYMTLLYDKMAPLIVAALKEEVQKRENLEKEVAELKQLVQNLLARQ